MSEIKVLDQVTIDKIAAGEVIERPSSVVKELVENAIDASASVITVEIKEGGTTFIRVADNGSGIPADQVQNAFLRHSTSKIRQVDDLTHLTSLGFRGEALSSIAAVSQVEVITKTKENTFGSLYRISGGKEEGPPREAGAPEGTTFLVRQLFYNTPARRKFLKTAMTEASHVSDLMTRMALSHPEISFVFIQNGQSKLHTSGNGSLKDVIYHIYGREIAANLLPAGYEKDGIKITGYLGAPLISRGNRNFETYFVDGRYVKDSVISKAIEDAYKDFTMQHKYPFVVLHIKVDGSKVDVNVHPSKMELRFTNQQQIYNAVYEAVDAGLHARELIPQVEPPSPEEEPVPPLKKPEAAKVDRPTPTAAEKQEVPPKEERNLDYYMGEMRKRVRAYHEQQAHPSPENKAAVQEVKETAPVYETSDSVSEQLTLPIEPLLKGEGKPDYRLIGQVFDTYWLVEYQENLYIIDQHAAHERVLYERTLKSMKNRDFTSQMVSPPIVLHLTMHEKELLTTYMDQFTRIGFEFEPFGPDDYALRSVPDNLFSIAKKELLLEMLDDLSEEVSRKDPPEILDEKIASMSCKAAVKGNMKLSAAEMDALIGELLTLDNPYHCPHGRPTIIAMSKRELEKKFKRIV